MNPQRRTMAKKFDILIISCYKLVRSPLFLRVQGARRVFMPASAYLNRRIDIEWEIQNKKLLMST